MPQLTNNYKRLLEYLRAKNYEEGCYDPGFSKRSTHYKGGYNTVHLGNSTQSAHRIALEFKLGRSLESCEVVRHTCNNPACVNPHHLLVGSMADNAHDRDKCGNTVIPRLKGEKAAAARLTDKELEEIRKLKGCGISQAKIGKLYGVGQQQISRIWNNQSRRYN